MFACQVTKEGYTCTPSPIGGRGPNTAPCLRGVLAPKNLIRAFDKEDIPCTSSFAQNGGLKRTFSVIDNGNSSHESKKMRLQFLDQDHDEYLFKHPNPLSTHSDQTDYASVHIFYS